MYQKQIIKQLKCLIAKQQVEINSLHRQIKQLKKYISQSQIEKYQKNHLNNNVHQSEQHQQKKIINSNKNIQNQQQSFESNQPDQNNYQPTSSQKTLKIIYQQLQNFYNPTYLTIKQKHQLNYSYQNQNYQQEYLIKLPKQFNSIEQFTNFFPSLLNEINTILISINNQIEQYKQKQISLTKKIFSQQKALKQIFNEYEKNIQQSQIMQQKLVKQIQILKSNYQKYQGTSQKFYHHQIYKKSLNDFYQK